MRPNADDPDEGLAVRAKRGDQEAVSALVRRHAPGLYAFLRRYHPDRDDCDDLLQETWIRVVANLNGYDPGKRFAPWLFRIARNLCLDLARRREARFRLQRAVQEQEARAAAFDAERGADTRKALRAIEALPLPQKEVLLLRYYHGFSEGEVAEILDCPRGTVKSRLHQAVKALRGRLLPNAEGG